MYTIYRLVPASGTTWGGGGGVGWDVDVHVALRQDVNVHVNLRQQWMLRTCGVGGEGWDVNVHVTLRQDVNVHEPRKPELGW